MIEVCAFFKSMWFKYTCAKDAGVHLSFILHIFYFSETAGCFWRNLSGRKSSKYSTKFVFFGPI